MPDELDDLLSKVPAAPRSRGAYSRPRAAPRSLNPQLAQQADEIVSAVKARGFDVRLGSTVRTPAEQAAKVAQGLSRTFNSRHLTGDAADFNAYDEHGNYIADGSHPAYAAIGEEARKRGLTWGGDFKSFHDPSHVELPRAAAPRDALDTVLDQIPVAPSSGADDDLDKVLAGVPSVESADYSVTTSVPHYSDAQTIKALSPNPNLDAARAFMGTPVVAAAARRSRALPPTPAPAPKPFDAYDLGQRRKRDALAAAETRPGINAEIAVKLPLEYSKLTPREVGELAVKQSARAAGYSDEIASAVLAKHPEIGLYDFLDAQGKPAEHFYESVSFDPATRTLKVGAESKRLADLLKEEYTSRSTALGRGVTAALDDRTTAGEKAAAVVSSGAHALDIATRPLQAASTAVAGQQRAAGAMLAAPFSRSARDTLASGLYEPSAQIGAALHKLTTGETLPGYESPIGEGADLLSQKFLRKPLPGVVRGVLDVAGDPTNYLPFEAANKVGAAALSRAARGVQDSKLGGFVERASRALSDAHDPRVEELFNSGGRIIDLRPVPSAPEHAYATILAGDGSHVRVNLATGEYTDLGAAPHPSNYQPRDPAGAFTPGSPADVASGGDELDHIIADIPHKSPNLRPPVVPRVLRGVADVVNAPKAVMASYDASGVVRPGVMLWSAHPTYLKQMLADYGKAMASEGAAKAFTDGILARGDLDAIRGSGLHLASLGNKEEPFASRFTKNIPGVKQSERGYNAGVDSLRLQAWDRYTDELQELGYTFENSPDLYKATARHVNVLSGRGLQPKSRVAKAVVEGLNLPFFSPQLIASRFQAVNPVRYALMPAPLRKLAAVDAMRSLSTLGATAGLASMAGARVGLNPLRGDFMKFQIGGTSYDPTSSVSGAVRYAARMAQAFSREARGEQHKPNESPKAITLRYLRSQLSPSAGLLVDWKTGKDFNGQPFKWTDAVVSRAVPLVAGDMYEGWKDAGGSSVAQAWEHPRAVKTGFSGALKYSPSLVGVSVMKPPAKRFGEWGAARGGAR
jgi:peptidoglycan L-alanyl-D-glutamate endopeptidase CwlK